MTKKRSEQLRRLAAVLSRQPETAYQRMADLAGISRSTLYRLAPSREALVELLFGQAQTSVSNAIRGAQLRTAPPIEALAKLTLKFVEDAELHRFWVNANWDHAASGSGSFKSDPIYAAYREEMLMFFERGRGLGCFRSDVPPAWMVASYDALFEAPTYLDTMPPQEPGILANMLLKIFLGGAGTTEVRRAQQ